MVSVQKDKIIEFFDKPFFRNKSTLIGLWAFIGVIAAVAKLHSNNNYLIFKYVYYHTIHQTSLYAEYPSEYFDTNHYGPLFSLVIAPFAILPDWMGMILWCLLLALLLYWSVTYLPKSTRIFVIWFCAHELLTALFMQQYNVAIAAGIVFSFYFVEKEKDLWAAFWIVLGTFVKLYGIVGLAFFFFSKHKTKFILYCILWAAILFALPMLISSPEYVVGQYREWFVSLSEKNAGNITTIGGTNISLLGMVRRISGCFTYSDLWLIIPGMALFAIPYLRLNQYNNYSFRQTYLASVLMFTILFSTGSESSGYITALTGVVIWYCAVPWKRSKLDIALLVYVFILSSMSPSDLFPSYIRQNFVQPYSLKALPVAIVWFKLCYEMIVKDYKAIA